METKTQDFNQDSKILNSFLLNDQEIKKPSLLNPILQLQIAWKIFIKNWQPLILLALLPMFLNLIFGFFALLMKWIVYIPFDQLEFHKDDNIVSLLGFVFSISENFISNFPLMITFGLVFVILELVAYLISLIGQIIVLKNANKKIDLQLIINQILHYLGNFSIFLIFYYLIFLLGLIFLIIPAIIFIVFFNFGKFAIIFEDCSVKEAFKRSKELVKGYWWAVFNRYIFWIIFSLLIGISMLLLRIISNSDYLTAIVSNLISLILTPLSIIYFFVIYENLKLINNKINK